MIEIDAKSEGINFRATAEFDQKLILGIDSCKLFNIDVRLGLELVRKKRRDLPYVQLW